MTVYADKSKDAAANSGAHFDTYDKDDTSTSRPPSLPMGDPLLEGMTAEEIAQEEKELVRKVDRRLVPAVWLMYLFLYLDRSNIGNAYTAGMGKDLTMNSTHYSIVLLVFFISYVLFEVPSNMLLTRVRPSYYLPALMMVWGAISICFAAGKSWQVIAVLRVILGAIEAGFAPGVLFLLSSWYTKNELARRYSLYYSAVAISGMIGGLLKEFDGARGIPGWKWLFIVDGRLQGICTPRLSRSMTLSTGERMASTRPRCRGLLGTFRQRSSSRTEENLFDRSTMFLPFLPASVHDTSSRLP